jgi:hypothetical protein
MKMMKKRLGQEESKNIRIMVLGIIDGGLISGETEATMEILMLTEDGQELTHTASMEVAAMEEFPLAQRQAKQRETQMALSKKTPLQVIRTQQLH